MNPELPLPLSLLKDLDLVGGHSTITEGDPESACIGASLDLPAKGTNGFGKQDLVSVDRENPFPLRIGLRHISGIGKMEGLNRFVDRPHLGAGRAGNLDGLVG